MARLGVLRICLLVVLGVLLVGCSSVPAAPRTPSLAARPGSGLVSVPTDSAVSALLQRRASAVLARDAAGYAATVASDATEAVRTLPQRLAQVRLAAWSYTVESVEPGSGSGTVARVTLTYRWAGVATTATAQRRVTVVDGLVADDQPVGPSLPWDLGVVTETVDRRSVVLSVQPVELPSAQVAAEADRAVTSVDAVWGRDWIRQAVVVLVDGPTPLAKLLGWSESGVRGLVALTTVDRVTVDATALGALTEPAQQALLTHEVTHLATRAAATSSVPTWLKEGFADYVGLRGSLLPQAQLLAPLVAQVRSAGLPSALPTNTDFQAGTATQGAAYTEAWTAVRLIADTYGEAAVVRLYRVTLAGAGTPDADVSHALREVLGLSVQQFTATWRAEVAELVE